MENDNSTPEAQQWYGWLLQWAWDNKEAIQSRMIELKSWLFPPDKSAILIVGSGGVGKTTTAKLLEGRYDLPYDIPGGYEESIGLERYTLTDDPHVELLVPPGQEHRRPSTWPTIQAKIAAGELRGVILIGAYGYHTLGDIHIKDHKLYKGDKAEFLKAYLADRLQEELRILKQITPYIETNERKFWLLNLVTKQDLWWPEERAVLKFYREGEYGAQLTNLAAKMGPRFRSEYAFCSLVIRNFETSRHEFLANNTAGYGQDQQVSSVRRFFETLAALKEWEQR